MHLVLSLLVLLAVADAFWVGPLWGYQKGSGGDENNESYEEAGDVNHKYPGWLAPANLDEVLKRMSTNLRKKSSVSAPPNSGAPYKSMMFACVPWRTKCANGGIGPTIVGLAKGYVSLCECKCPPTHVTPGCL